MKLLRNILLCVFLVGYADLAILGTQTEMVSQWRFYLAAGLVAIISAFLLRRPAATPHTTCLIATALFVGYVLARAALSPVSYFARVEIAMGLAALITYLLFSVYLTGVRSRLCFAGALLLLCFGNVFAGLYQVIWDPQFLLEAGDLSVLAEKAGGFYGNHNHLGGFLIPVASFLVATTLFGRFRIRVGAGLLAAALVAGVGFVISASGGALLGCGLMLLALLGLGLFLAQRPYAREFKRVAAIAVVVVLPVILVLGITGWRSLGERAGAGSLPQDESASPQWEVRTTNWSLALDQWKAHPLVGQGARMYDVYSVKHWPGSMNWAHGDPEFAHNDYLQLLAEYGSLGFALFLLFLIAHVVAGLRYLARYRCEQPGALRDNQLALCLGALLTIAGYAVISVFDFNLHLPANLIPVAFAFAILARPDEPPAADPVPAPKLAKVSQLALPACGLYLVASGIFCARGEARLHRAEQLPLSQYSEILAHLDQSLQSDDRNFRAHRLRGIAQMRFGYDFEIEAVRSAFMGRAALSFERALEINPYDIFSIVGLARCLDETGEPDRAEELFLHAIELGPWRREPHLRYGYHHLKRGMGLIETNLVAAIGRFEQGKEQFLKSRRSNERVPFALGHDPDMITAGRYLSIAYEEHGHRLVDAAASLRLEGDAGRERAFLESARDNYARAASEAPERAGVGSRIAEGLNAAEARLAELGEPGSE